MGKEEIAQYLLFPQCFLLNQKIVSPFVHIFDVISLFAAELEKPKIGISGKELNQEELKLQIYMLHNISLLPTFVQTFKRIAAKL